MDKADLYRKISADLEENIHFLEDKPEETVDSTIRALWLMASGIPVSAEGAVKRSLPDLSADQTRKLHQLVELRLSHTPLAHITGRQSFMGIELLADKRALIPRKETEILGWKALELASAITASGGKIKIIDVCCGSGNLGLALAAHNQDCTVYSADLSDEAVGLTVENIAFLDLSERVSARKSDLLDSFKTPEFLGKIDLIVCNPPYILSSNVPKMNAEISSHEPVLAFDGGMLGIKIIKRLISDSPGYLSPEGWLVFEVGAGQGDFILKLCEKSDSYRNIQPVSDRAGKIRVIAAQSAQ